MRKAVIAAPLYISLAWTLMITYQIFTQTAVITIMDQINTFLPALGTWLYSRIDMIVFIYAFAWVFVLSSVIPSVILGKSRSIIIQFIVCLTLVFLAFIFQDMLTTYAAKPIEESLSLTALFQTPILAAAVIWQYHIS